MRLTLIALLVLCTCSTINAFKLVATAGLSGNCNLLGAYGIIKAQRYECGIMGGKWNGSPGEKDWINCHLDWCLLPTQGAVASGSVWGIDPNQDWPRTGNDRVYAVVPMERHYCDDLRGGYNGNPAASDWIDCHLFFVRKDGSNRNNVDTLVFSSVGGCANKLAYGIIGSTQADCQAINGNWNGNPSPNQWINCHLDICPPVV